MVSPVPFQAINTQRLYQQIAGQLAGLIQSGELRAGERLPPERDLSKRLGVSRPTVREAMVALEIAGLVEVRTGSGVYVQAPAAQSGTPLDAGTSPFELLGARRVVEGEIAALAATEASARDRADLSTLVDAHHTAITRGGEGFDADRDFHLALARATGNGVLARVSEDFWGEMRGPIFDRLGELSNSPAKHQTTLGDHERILRAVLDGDAGQAREAMHRHLRHVEGFFLTDTPLGPVGEPEG